MDLRERLFGPIKTRSESDGAEVDVGAVVRRLLLFDEYTMESSSLTELPAFINAFGIDGVMKLVAYTHFRILCDTAMVGVPRLGRNAASVRSDWNDVDPRGPISLQSIRIGTQQELIDHLPQRLTDSTSLSHKQAVKLAEELSTRLLSYPDEAMTGGIQDALSSISSGDNAFPRFVKRAARLRRVDDFECSVVPTSDGSGVTIATNLESLLPTWEKGIQGIMIENMLMAFARIHQRIRLMQSFNALTGFQEEDYFFFEDRVAFLVEQLDPSVQEGRFGRVITLAGLPSLDGLDANTHIDIERVLELREDPDCKEFRSWLRAVDGETESEIQSHFDSIQERLAAATHTRIGKGIRFATIGATGLIPGVGLIAGPISTLVDQFVVEKLIGKPGPIAFLGRKYESIF